MLDVRCQISDVGCRMSNLGCQMSDVGCRMSDIGCRMSDMESGMFDVGCWMSDGTYKLPYGYHSKRFHSLTAYETPPHGVVYYRFSITASNTTVCAFVD